MNRRVVLLPAALCLAVLWPRSARAEHTRDGIYGRFAGDSALALDLGGAVASSDPGLFARATFRYLQTAGLYVSWLDDFRKQPGPASRSVGVGVELRPLFLPRAGKDWQTGPATLNLFIDSLALRFGAVMGRQPGFEPGAPGVEAALGIGVPLAGAAAGPWLDVSAGLRFSDLQLSGREHAGGARAVLLTFTLGWQTLFTTHLVDAGDRL
jgi:hypothetical protein